MPSAEIDYVLELQRNPSGLLMRLVLAHTCVQAAIYGYNRACEVGRVI